ncbi:apidaecins type 73-like [Drosophila guanche]|uniref:apidaecins type 73-like n=1 Tax=Drosophila guanche TaxID=7266 RepID=UPI001471DD41|nr:apidaecins type 73-like [Drosophila guanche]
MAKEKELTGREARVLKREAKGRTQCLLRNIAVKERWVEAREKALVEREARPEAAGPEAAEAGPEVPEALRVLRAAAAILRAEALAREERAEEADQRPAVEPRAESAAEASETGERGPWLWPEPAPPAPTLKRPTADAAPPVPPFRRQASCPEPQRGHRPTLQRQTSEPAARRWTLLEPKDWPESVVRAQAGARLTGRRTNRLVTERGVRYRAAEAGPEVPEALRVLRAAAAILRAEALAREERAEQADQRPAVEPRAESAAEASETGERGPWLWPEPAPPAPTLKRPTADAAPPVPPFRRQASCPEPQRGHRPTLQRQTSEPAARRWTLLEPKDWPESVVRAQAGARLTGRRTNRLVTERGVRYRVTTSAAGTAVFRDQHSGRAE